MKYQIIRNTGTILVYDILDDDDNLLLGGASQEIYNVSNIDDFLTNVILPRYENKLNDTTVIKISRDVSSFEVELLDKKESTAIELLRQIKIQATPTKASVALAMEDYDQDLLAVVYKWLIRYAFNRGYINAKTWNAFVVKVKATSAAKLLEVLEEIQA